MIFRPIRQLVLFLLLMLSVALLIVACQTSSVEQSPASSGSTSAANNCRIVEHSMGETKVCGQPEKVVALSPHILDSILALGVQPAGLAQSVNSKIQIYDNPTVQIPYLGKWVTTKPMAVGSRESPSLESITLLQPDLILGEDWQNDQYSLLTQIAPTLLFDGNIWDGKARYWQQSIKGIARALGREKRAQELLAKRDEYIAQAREALQPVLQAYPRILLIGSGGGAKVMLESKNMTGILLEEIGFDIVQPEGVVGVFPDISWEILPQIETDIIIVFDWNDDRFMNPEVPRREIWAQKPIFNAIPAFKQGRVFFVDLYIWGNYVRGPLSERLILEALPDLLLSSVEEAKETKPDA